MAAAVVVPMFWERGSLLATAITPIIVAIVSEALNRPAKVITKAAPRVTRRTGTGAAVRAEQPTGVGARGEGPERVSRWGDEDDPFGLRTPQRRRRRRFPWKLAITTGLLAAVIGAAVVTASELALFGHSVGHSDRSTSVFGGKRASATPTATPTADGDADRDGDRGRRPRRRPPTPTETATPRDRDRDPHRHAARQATPQTGTPPTTEATPGADAVADGQGQDPHLADRPHGEGVEPRRRARPRATSARARRTSRAPRRASRPRSSAATSRPPSRS